MEGTKATKEQLTWGTHHDCNWCSIREGSRVAANFNIKVNYNKKSKINSIVNN